MLVRKIKNVEHRVYDDKKEFRQYCPNDKLTRNWRDGTEGSWVTTDDGKVCQVLKRGELRNSQSTGVCNYYIRTAIGSFVCRDGMKMASLRHLLRHTRLTMKSMQITKVRFY